jgi:hypothetical protein
MLFTGFPPDIGKEYLLVHPQTGLPHEPFLLLALLALGQEESVLVMTNISLSGATGAASSDAGVATHEKNPRIPGRRGKQ